MEPFEQKVLRTIEVLEHGNVAGMAAEITRKRLDWLERVLPQRPGYEQFTPRQAFELLFS